MPDPKSEKAKPDTVSIKARMKALNEKLKNGRGDKKAIAANANEWMDKHRALRKARAGK